MQSFELNNHETKESNHADLFELRDGLIEEKDKILDELEENGAEIKELDKAEHEIVSAFIEKLKKEKELFQYVFETETGSVYFVSQSGDSWRFKMEDGNFNEQPILKKIIFISEAEKERLLEIKMSEFFQEKLINNKIQKSEIRPGLYPLEIGISTSSEVVFEETDDTITILGTKAEDGIEPIFASGIHLGDKIEKIY